MCGIAGIIHTDGAGDVGLEMTKMLQSMKHRGPDSTGYALYGEPQEQLVMRFKLADPNEVSDFDFSERLERSRRTTTTGGAGSSGPVTGSSPSATRRSSRSTSPSASPTASAWVVCPTHEVLWTG